MLQSKHYEEEGDKIIKELLEDLQIHDMHKSMAVIFDKKNEQILQLKRQNTALRKKNLELQKQVQILPLNQSGLPVEYQPSGYNSSGMNFSSESEKEKMI